MRPTTDFVKGLVSGLGFPEYEERCIADTLPTHTRLRASATSATYWSQLIIRVYRAIDVPIVDADDGPKEGSVPSYPVPGYLVSLGWDGARITKGFLFEGKDEYDNREYYRFVTEAGVGQGSWVKGDGLPENFHRSFADAGNAAIEMQKSFIRQAQDQLGKLVSYVTEGY